MPSPYLQMGMDSWLESSSCRHSHPCTGEDPVRRRGRGSRLPGSHGVETRRKIQTGDEPISHPCRKNANAAQTTTPATTAMAVAAGFAAIPIDAAGSRTRAAR